MKSSGPPQLHVRLSEGIADRYITTAGAPETELPENIYVRNPITGGYQRHGGSGDGIAGPDHEAVRPWRSARGVSLAATSAYGVDTVFGSDDRMLLVISRGGVIGEPVAELFQVAGPAGGRGCSSGGL